MDAIKRHWDIRSADYNDFVVRGFSIERGPGRSTSHPSSAPSLWRYSM